MEKAEQQISCLELKAAILALKAFLKSRDAASTPESGPLSPTSYPSGNGKYNRRCLCEQEGGTQSPSLSLLALELWSFLLNQGAWVTVHHLPGVLNVEADAASREFNMRTEWMLRQDVFQDIADHFYVPETAASLCVRTSRPQCFSSGCLSTGLEPVEEFHPPTSGATASNSSESEKRQSNRPTSSPRLARSTMVCSDSSDPNRYTVPTCSQFCCSPCVCAHLDRFLPCIEDYNFS